MFRKTVKTEKPVAVKVGDVTFHIVKIGERIIDLTVDAPKDQKIEIGTPYNKNENTGGR